jgi:hypothetical protein
MTIDNKSEFLASQQDICEIGPKPEVEPDKICPTCIPDESFVPPDWWTLDKPFLNKKTCEYSIGVTINENGDIFKVDTIAAATESNGFEALKRSYVKPGIKMMLQYYGKMISDEIVCALPPQEPGDDCGPTFDINFLEYIEYVDKPVDLGTSKFVAHSVPMTTFNEPPVVQGMATNLDALEVYARTPEFRFTTTNDTGTLQILVTVPAFIFDKIPEAPDLPEVDTSVEKVTMDAEKFYLHVNEAIAALDVFSKFQSYFYQTQNGNLFFADSQKSFYLKNVVARMKSFLRAFETLIESNGMRFGRGISFMPKAQQIEIVFDKEDETKPFKIKRVRAKEKNCKWKKMKKGFSNVFLKNGAVKDQTTMGYISAIEKMHPRLTARETPPWLDFVIEFTYPQLAIDFGSSDKFKDQRLDTCLSDVNAISNVILNTVMTFSDAFAYQLNKANCLSMYGPDYVFDTTPADFNEKDMKMLGSIPSFGFDSDRFKAETFNGKKQYMKEYVQNKYRKQKRVMQENSPLYKALSDFKLSFEGDENAGDALKTLMSMFSPCSFKEFALTLTRCLFRGVSLKTAYMSVIKSALKNIAGEGLEIVIQALPADKQEEIRQIVQQEFKDMPAPWEPGWKAGSLQQPRINRATEDKDRRLNAESGLLSLKNKLKQLFKELKKSSFTGQVEISFKPENSDPLESGNIGYIISYDPSDEEGFSSIDLSTASSPLGDTDLKIDVLKFKITQTSEQINEYITNITNYIPVEGSAKMSEVIDTKTFDKEKQLIQVSKDLAALKEERDQLLEALADNELEAMLGPDIVQSYKDKIFSLKFRIEEKEDELKQINQEITDLLNGNSPDIKVILQDLSKKASSSLAKIEQMRGESLTLQKDLEETRQYDDWNNLSEEEKEKLIETEANKSRFASLNPGDSYEQGTLGKALGNTQQAITKAYVDAIIETAEIQQIMRALDNIPGIKILGSFIAKFKCPNTHFIFPPIDSFLNSLTFDPCDLLATDMALPEFKQFPRFSWSFILDNLVKAFIAALKITLKQALTALFAKLAQLIDASLCKLLGLQLPQIPSLMDVLGRADCKESEILKAAGAAPEGRAPLPEEEYGILAETISNAGSEVDMKLALSGTPSRSYLKNVANAIQAESPAFSDVLSSPGAVGEFFEAASGLLSDSQLQALQDEVNTAPILESPTNKCLTNAELAETQQNINQGLSSLPSDILEEYNQQEQDRSQDNLDQVINIVLNGPNTVLSDIIDQALSPTVDPDCIDNINSAGAVLQKARETESFKNVKEGIFGRVQKAFMDDMVDWNLFEVFDTPGILGQILADKKGGTLNYYNWYRNLKSSLGALAFIFPESADLPETVAITLRKQFLNEEKKWDQKETPKMNFRFKVSEDDEDFETNIKVFGGGKSSFAHKARIVTPEFTDVEIEVHEPVEEIHKKMLAELAPFIEDGGNYRTKVMKALIKKSWSNFENINITDKNADNLIGAFNKAMFSKMMNKLVSDSNGNISQGFLYGHTPVEITAEDLTYVNPEPNATEYTYEDSAQVLGRSLTNNPRVQFLDPLQHGGTYSSPFYNILAEEKEGWSQFAKVIVSNIKGCDSVQSNFMFFQDIMDKISKDEASIKPDERLQLAPDCVQEKPFDKIASPTTLSTLGGIVTAIIRAHIVDYMLRTYPINSNVSMNFDRNHSKLISKLIVNRLQDSLTNQTSVFTSTYEGGVYWLLFLEQAVQLLKRKVDNADIESNPELETLFESLNEAQKLHVVPTYADIFGDNSDQGLINNVTVGAVIAAGGFALVPGLAAVIGITSVLSSAFRLNQLKFSAKLGTIYSTLEECKGALEYLVEEQLNFYSEMLSESIQPRPYIHDISKYFIGGSNSMIKGDIRAGEVEIESPTGGVSNFDYGSISNCVSDINFENPLSNVDLSSYDLMLDGGFFLEKYLRIEDKIITPAVISSQKIQLNRSFISNRNDKLKGVVNIESFKEFLSLNGNKIPADANISDFFGNAKSLLIEDGYSGSIGIKFGVRLCCVMPFRFEPFKTTNAESANFTNAQREKSYIFKTSPTEEARYIFPICSFERDIPDNKLASYIDSDENFNQDLKCYVDALCETAEFKLLFDHVVSTKRIPSIASIYSYLNFYSSLGKDSSEREDEDDINTVRLDNLFNDTRNELRKMFVSNYKRKDFDPPNEEETEGGFMKDLTRDMLSKTVNKIFIGAKVPWWMKAKYKQKKVDEDGEPCGNQFGGLVNIGGGE